MKNHEEIAERLAQVMMVAARNSIAAGAVYESHEDLTTQDPLKVWRGVADSILNIVETAVKEERELTSS